MSHRLQFSAEDPASLAGWLLDEIARGLVPVWPTTSSYARRIVDGLARLHDSRRGEVMNAISTVPETSVLDWAVLLTPIRAKDAATKDTGPSHR